MFKGYDEEEGVEVAWCQVVMDRVGETEKTQIRAEVEILKGLAHKHILTFIDWFELAAPSKPIVFITEYMSSGTLKQCAPRPPSHTDGARLTPPMRLRARVVSHPLLIAQG